MGRPAIDMSGKTINGRLVIGRVYLAHQPKHACWRVRCLKCGREADTKGSDLRFANNGCPHCDRTGDRHWFWQGDKATYGAAHQRIRRLLGPARDHACVDCSAPARDWSYKEKTGYSLDPTDYSPRCRPCHETYDRKAP